MRHFYGFEHTYGMGIIDGRRIGRLFRFDSRAARDTWAGNGPDYTTAPYYREALKASDPVVRRAMASPVAHTSRDYNEVLFVTETGYEFWEVEDD